MADQDREVHDPRGDFRRTPFIDVGEFHRKMGLPAVGDRRVPAILTYDMFKYRKRFMQEELDEFIEAYYDKNIEEMADALVDLVYVALGTAHYMGVPFDLVWDEVQRANMQKRRWQEGDPIKPRAAGGAIMFDVVKPKDWQPPDIRTVLNNYRNKISKGD